MSNGLHSQAWLIAGKMVMGASIHDNTFMLHYIHSLTDANMLTFN